MRRQSIGKIELTDVVGRIVPHCVDPIIDVCDIDRWLKINTLYFWFLMVFGANLV